MYQGKWRLLSMAIVRRWWLRRITYRPDYVGFNRSISTVSRACHFGLCLNDYVLYSILWTFGPIRTVVEAELVLGLFFRHQGALSSYNVYLDAEWHNSISFLGAQVIARNNGAYAVQPSTNRRQDTFPPWERFSIRQIFIVVRLLNLQYTYA